VVVDGAEGVDSEGLVGGATAAVVVVAVAASDNADVADVVEMAVSIGSEGADPFGMEGGASFTTGSLDRDCAVVDSVMGGALDLEALSARLSSSTNAANGSSIVHQ